MLHLPIGCVLVNIALCNQIKIDLQGPLKFRLILLSIPACTAGNFFFIGDLVGGGLVCLYRSQSE